MVLNKYTKTTLALNPHNKKFAEEYYERLCKQNVRNSSLEIDTKSGLITITEEYIIHISEEKNND